MLCLFLKWIGKKCLSYSTSQHCTTVFGVNHFLLHLLLTVCPYHMSSLSFGSQSDRLEHSRRVCEWRHLWNFSPLCNHGDMALCLTSHLRKLTLFFWPHGKTLMGLKGPAEAREGRWSCPSAVMCNWNMCCSKHFHPSAVNKQLCWTCGPLYVMVVLGLSVFPVRPVAS